MAYTLSTVFNTALGDKRVRAVRVTADAAETNLSALGFGVIETVSIAPEKGQTMPAAHVNKNSSGTASNGGIGISGCSSGNIFQMIIYGH